MSLHHGIELLSKQLLFEKGGEIYKENGKVIEFEQTINALKSKKLIEVPLENDLKRLNKYRNLLAHNELNVDIDIEFIKGLIFKMKIFFEKELKLFLCGEENSYTRDIAILNKKNNDEKRVFRLVSEFDSQSIDGNIFNIDEKIIILPSILRIERNKEIHQIRRLEIDILATDKNGSQSWVVEVKSAVQRFSEPDLVFNTRRKSRIINAKAWIVYFGQASERLKFLARKSGVMLTDHEAFKKLEEHLNINSM